MAQAPHRRVLQQGRDTDPANRSHNELFEKDARVVIEAREADFWRAARLELAKNLGKNVTMELSRDIFLQGTTMETNLDSTVRQGHIIKGS